MILNRIQRQQRFITLSKELLRKSIHLCAGFVPFMLNHFYMPTVCILIAAVTIYSLCEVLRMYGITVPVVSAVTSAASRKRDENHFVKGPVTLCLGILITALVFYKKSPMACSIGIYALAFGDGLASLIGKFMGRMRIPLTQGKTAAGSLACFFAIYVSSYLTCVSFGYEGSFAALICASVGMFMELLPLKDFDNLVIPVVIAEVALAIF